MLDQVGLESYPASGEGPSYVLTIIMISVVWVPACSGGTGEPQHLTMSSVQVKEAHLASSGIGCWSELSPSQVQMFIWGGSFKNSPSRERL